MAEQSYFWDGVILGDAAIAPYSSDEFHTTVLAALLTGGSGLQSLSFISPVLGVGSLLVTGVVSPVAIAAGYAMVNGRLYYNSSTMGLVVASPAANPRIDRVVLRVNWAAQTIRLALLAGTEAAIPAPPALTQVSGTTWEISLAQVYVTTGGVITIRDERQGGVSLAPGVLFRDLQGRMLEEFFDNFSADLATPPGWNTTLTGSAAIAKPTGVPTASTISVTSSVGAAILHRGATIFPTELAQAPLLFEARFALAATAPNADMVASMRLINSGSTQIAQFGVQGSVSATSLMLANTNGGVTSFVTGQAIDAVGGYHTYGLYVPSSAGPIIGIYDGVPIGSIVGNIPASTTDLRVDFALSNGGGGGVARSINIDWARLVRGTA